MTGEVPGGTDPIYVLSSSHHSCHTVRKVYQYESGSVLVQIRCCTGTVSSMGRAGYRVGQKQVTVWLSPVRHGQLKTLAGEASMQDTMDRLIAEEFERRGRGGTDAERGLRVVAQADERRPRYDPGSDGFAPAGIESRHVADTGFVNLTGNPKLDALNDLISKQMEAKAASRVSSASVVLPGSLADQYHLTPPSPEESSDEDSVAVVDEIDAIA